MVYLHLAVIVKYIGIEYSLVSRFKLTLSVDLIVTAFFPFTTILHGSVYWKYSE